MGNRTPVFAVRGRRPGPLDDGSAGSGGSRTFLYRRDGGKARRADGLRGAVFSSGWRGDRGRTISSREDFERGVDGLIDLIRRHGIDDAEQQPLIDAGETKIDE